MIIDVQLQIYQNVLELKSEYISVKNSCQCWGAVGFF